MKLNTLRYIAYKKVCIETAAAVLAPFVIFAVIKFAGNYFHWFEFQFTVWQGAVFLLAQPMLIVIGIAVRIVNRHDTKVFHELYSNVRDIRQQKRQKYKEIVQDFSKEYYIISDVKPVPGHCGTFKIFFRYPVKSDVAKELVPEVRMHNSLISFIITGKHEITCQLEKHLKADEETFPLMCGGVETLVDNPYCFDLNKATIVWQNEGHVHEKKIFINGDCLSCKVDSLKYAFDFLINGVSKGTFYGVYNESSNQIVVDIAEISKKECKNKNCIIRLSFDKSVSIRLPLPQVLAVNTVAA
jgi:hypothetical protein